MRLKLNILPYYVDELKKIAEKVIKREKIKGEINITIVDDKYIRKLNKKYLKENSTTDVISFYFKQDEKFETIGGDIYISIEQASKQKKSRLIDELKLLMIHGLLHIAGYRDDNERERKIMRKKENEYL